MMLSLRNNKIWLGLALAALWACSDDDKSKDTEGDPSVEGDAGSDESDAGSDEHPGDSDKSILPIVFVHGFAGSASQFDSNAQRFVANDYPPNKLSAFDHDGAGLDIAGYANGLDTLIDAQREKFGVDQVYLIGHSRGTAVSVSYLSDAARAKKVAKVILIDGSGCAMAPAAIPCAAPNQAGFPGQAHVNVATSAEAFKMQYKFLFDKDPEVVDIVKQSEPVEIAGRAVNFPANTGREGRTLDIYALKGETGERDGEAIASITIPASGEWGPVKVDPDKYYELRLNSETEGSYQHFYFQKFLRSTKFIRLLSGPPESPSRMNTNSGPGHAALTMIRMREWYGPGVDNKPADKLRVQVKTPQGDVDVPEVVTMHMAQNRIAVYLHDDKATPKKTTLEPLPYFPMQAFQTGYDVYMPASDPPDGSITVTNYPRGESKAQVLRFPNWSSDKHTIMVMYADFSQ
jgi:pimeloyl-ACP methyl ester carboxylesterase